MGYVLTLASASVSQAGQQAFIPDLVPEGRRGLASGLKGFADLIGATCGFLVLGGMLGSAGSRESVAVAGGVLVAGYVATRLLVREPAARPHSAVNLAWSNPFRLDLRRHRRFMWLVASRLLFLTGSYAVSRFFLFFVGDRLHLDPDRAAEQAGALLAALSLVTLLAAPVAGQAADRIARIRLMEGGAALTAAGALLLIWAGTSTQIFVFGGVMAVGNAAFAAANWAMTADVVPDDGAARFMGIANLGTMGAAAVAGLLGPVVDALNRGRPGAGYTILFAVSAGACATAFFAARRVAAFTDAMEAIEP
jgi:MFS family permease